MTAQQTARLPRARATTLRGARSRLTASALIAAALVLTLITPGPAADAVDQYGYPTWSEVEAARGNEAAKNRQITEIRSLLAQLESNLSAANALADQRAAEAAAAQEEYDQAVFVADELQAQADAARAEASASSAAASQLAAELARTGGAGDMSSELFANPGSADEWLYRLGLMDAVASSADTVYERAQRDANTAQSLQDQASVARDELGALRDQAESAYQASVQAAAAAQAILDQQTQHKADLEAQLSVLVENRAATEADYNAGQQYRAWLAEQERIRLQREAEERERQRQIALEQQRAAAAAAAAQGGGSSGGSGGSGGGASSGGSTGGGIVGPSESNSGWTTPHYGRLSSGYGWRTDPLGRGRKLHAGLDIVGGCGTPIYAAAAGTVVTRGYDLAGANMLVIDHGNGVRTEYFHMVRPAHVAPGQSVSAGQVVAYEGSTGLSTGCHLHFQVRVNGLTVDPGVFLRSRGVRI